MKSWLGQHNSNGSIVLYCSPLRVAIWFYLRMWYFRSSTQLIFPVVRSLSQITDQTRIPLPSHHLKYGKGWSRGCEFRGETWYNKVRYMRNFPFGSSICSRITICMRMYAMGQVRRCFVEPWGPRWCKCGNLILFFFLLQARNFECTSSEIDEIARDEGRDKERKSRGLWWRRFRDENFESSRHGWLEFLFEQNTDLWDIDRFGIKFVCYIDQFQWLVTTNRCRVYNKN